MKQFMIILLPFMLIHTASACTSSDRTVHETYQFEESEFTVLVFTKTEGWRHDSIEVGVEAVVELGRLNGFNVTWTENSEYFTEENLSAYDAVVFLNTTLTVFTDAEREAFKAFIRNGGGFAGIHSATDTEYDWPWYGELVGAYFENHPPGVHEAIINVINHNHPSTSHLDDTWVKVDEWYNFGYMNENVNILLKLDTDSFEGSDHPGNHPIAWYHEYDGGRSFYTGLGHTKESFSEPLFLDHLLGGIQYAIGIQ